MTYKPGFTLSPMDTINLIGWEAQQLAQYIKMPPMVQGPDGQVCPQSSFPVVLRTAWVPLGRPSTDKVQAVPGNVGVF